MPLIQPAFTRKHLDRKKDTITIKMSKESKFPGDFSFDMLDAAKGLLRQPKDSSVIKQLAAIGYKSVTDQKNAEILGIIFDNVRRNKRTGVPMQD